MGPLAAYGGDFGVTLGLFWLQFGVSLGDFGSLEAYFAMIVESFWIYEGGVHFQKTLISPADLIFL